MSALRSFITGVSVASFCFAAPLAHSQTIAVESLDAPKAFAPGIDLDDALDVESWQGTSAERARRLLSEMNLETDHPVLRDMLRRVILSGLVPPEGAGDEFERLRIRAAQALATPDEYARFAARNASSQAPALRADAYLAQGKLDAACEISDTLVEGRGESYWVRLRAACHESREEIAAADLARDLLRDRGEPTEIVIADPPEGFWLEMMALDQDELNTFMAERAEYPEIEEVSTNSDIALAGSDPAATMPQNPDEPVPLDLLSFPSGDTVPLPAPEPEPEPVAPFMLEDALEDMSDRGAARLFELGRAGDAQAVSAFVGRAVEQGLDADRVLSRIPAVLDPMQMAEVNLPLFARHAVATRDIPMIQALYIATENEGIKERLALASDALGGGYIGRPLGQGLETALQGNREGAVRDVLIALALGAHLSEPVELILTEQALVFASGPEWVGVDQAIDRGAKAETLLRLAQRLEQAPEEGLTLYQTLRALREANLSSLAGQLAAYEFLRELDG